MAYSTKIAYSRLLYANFISDGDEEREIIRRINGFGFTISSHEGKTPTKFSTGDIGNFLGQLRSVCNSDSDLLNYVSNVFFWIYSDGILPLEVAIIEVILKTEEFQKLSKTDLEDRIKRLSFLLGSCFIEGFNYSTRPSNEFSILKFSSKAATSVPTGNFVAEFVIEAERKFFDDFNEELDSLEKEVFVKDLGEEKIVEFVDNGKIPESEVGRIVSKLSEKQEERIRGNRTRLISMEPVSFYEGEFSYDQSIIRGYANEIFIVGKIVQGSLDNSTPLYLTFLTMGGSGIPLTNLESMPVLQFPGTPLLLDFSSGAGQLLALQLLNSWNRYVEMSVKGITKKQSIEQRDLNRDTEVTLQELRSLIFLKGINEKISVNYLDKLNDLAHPSKKTFLQEFPIPPKEDTPYSINPEKYGLEKPGPIVSNLASLILKNLDLNEKYLLDATDIRKSKIDVLKIEEDRKYSRTMLSFTVVIAIATIVNVAVFLLTKL